MPVDSSAVLIVMLPAAKDVLRDARAVKIAAARLAVLRVLMGVIINAAHIAAIHVIQAVQMYVHAIAVLVVVKDAERNASMPAVLYLLRAAIIAESLARKGAAKAAAEHAVIAAAEHAPMAAAVILANTVLRCLLVLIVLKTVVKANVFIAVTVNAVKRAEDIVMAAV
jgi:hypothetical protein